MDLIVVHRSDGSGTTYVFTDYLTKVSAEWKDKVGLATSVNWPVGLGGKGNEGVTQQVKQVEGAIGYVELIYAMANNLPYAAAQERGRQVRGARRSSRSPPPRPASSCRPTPTSGSRSPTPPAPMPTRSPRSPGCWSGSTPDARQGQADPGLPHLDDHATRPRRWRRSCTTRRCRRRSRPGRAADPAACESWRAGAMPGSGGVHRTGVPGPHRRPSHHPLQCRDQPGGGTGKLPVMSTTIAPGPDPAEPADGASTLAGSRRRPALQGRC